MGLLERVLIFSGSIISIGFGIWHLFIPNIWKWYSYIESSAKELIIAVRAINIFFSLSLILFGLINLLFAVNTLSNKYSIVIMLAATSILWFTRVILQIIYPQGSMTPLLQYGMLSLFILVFLCFIVSLILVVVKK